MEAGQALDQQSRPCLCTKKKRRDKLIRLLARHPEWQLAYQDEVWWSRLAQPHLSTWIGPWTQDPLTQERPLPLVEKEVAKTDTDPKAIACYGALLADTGQMLLRFVQGRPISQVTCDFLGWLADKMAQAGKQGLVLIWDNASWHISKIVKNWLNKNWLNKNWLKAHNRHVKKEGGCRLVVCFLPSKSPWLNAIEPKWVHGKRAIMEPVRTLTATELMARICAYYGCEHEPLLIQHIAQKVC
jgi:transposase